MKDETYFGYNFSYIDKRRVDKKSYAENYSWLIEKIEQMKDVSPI